MIPAHGARVSLNADTLSMSYSPLAAALHGVAEVTYPTAEITDPQLLEPTAYLTGELRFHTTSGEHCIIFAPHQVDEARRLLNALYDAHAGRPIDPDLAPEQPALPPKVPGLDFVALDVETANGDWGSICQVGVVRFLDGREIAAQSWRCRPPASLAEFHPANIAIHGIQAADVANAPEFAEVLPQLLDFLGEFPLIAHNAQFDTTAVVRACRASQVPVPSAYFACSLALSRALALTVDNHRLPTLAQALGVVLEQHHDAAADARACGEIVAALARREQYQGSLAEFSYSLGLTLGSLGPQQVSPVLKDPSGAGIALQRTRLADVPAQVAADLEETLLESAPAAPRPKPAWQSVATPEEIPKANLAADPDHPLYGQQVTLSGDFEPYDKERLWTAIATFGGQVGKNVTKKTSILVAGPWQQKTSKQKRAEELIAKGQRIEIWSADQLFAVLGLETTPPF